jgi:hypothetical protein
MRHPPENLRAEPEHPHALLSPLDPFDVRVGHEDIRIPVNAVCRQVLFAAACFVRGKMEYRAVWPNCNGWPWLTTFRKLEKGKKDRRLPRRPFIRLVYTIRLNS